MAPGWGVSALRATRALLVVLHLVAVTLAAAPSVGPAGLDRRAWKQATVQGEFRAWSERLGALGVAVGPEQLEEVGWQVATTVEGWRTWALTPFVPYFQTCGTWQSWKMFVAPHRFPSRLEIAIDTGDGEFRTVYRARDPERAWHRAWFDHDRMRAATFRYGWEHYRPARKQFADWVARVAGEEFPTAARVRVTFLRTRTRSPEEVVASGGAASWDVADEPLVQTRELR